MDVKTLSTIIGHVSAKTTLSICTHVTDAMQETAAAKIDRGIGKCTSRKTAPSQDEVYPPERVRRAVRQFLSRTRANTADPAQGA